MYQLNSYLRKVSLLVLAILMFIAIPNLEVYPSIGSYQTGSTAITANKRYQPIKINNANNIADALAPRAALPAEEVLAAIRDWARAKGRYYYDGCLYPSSKDAAKNYTKYDFSGFDN